MGAIAPSAFIFDILCPGHLGQLAAHLVELERIRFADAAVGLAIQKVHEPFLVGFYLAWLGVEVFCAPCGP